MITGIIVYDASDLKRLQMAFGQATALPLWGAALVMCVVGAVLGLGVASLVQRLLDGPATLLGDVTPWGALLGAVLAVTAGAWRIGKATAGPIVAKPQTVEIGDTGIRLATPKGESLMRWPIFVKKVVQPGYVALRTEDNSWVLLRPEFFASADDYAAALRLVDANFP
ncbi:MAG TPA: hypothetical protein VGV07_04080 [Devosia sp.]|jgi:hypothetical protein|uniref:hypothetical protein n=1 Tax=Devosia sp. TaxID=1871048 RepID=UPI002DDD2BB5|nr:hypothetical protein [Devosia sp.]HEV2514403.1 hypothetical protein [Devosia sp.]